MKKLIFLFAILFAQNAKAQIYSDTLVLNDSTQVIASYNDGTKIFNCQLRYIGVEGKTFVKKPLIIDTADDYTLEPKGKLYSGLKITSRAKNAKESVAFKIGKNEYVYSYGLEGTKPSLKRKIEKDTEGMHNDNDE